MLKNHWNTFKICLLGQTTNQPSNKFEPWKSWRYKQLWELGPDPRYQTFGTGQEYYKLQITITNISNLC